MSGNTTEWPTDLRAVYLELCELTDEVRRDDVVRAAADYAAATPGIPAAWRSQARDAALEAAVQARYGFVIPDGCAEDFVRLFSTQAKEGVQRTVIADVLAAWRRVRRPTALAKLRELQI